MTVKITGRILGDADLLMHIPPHTNAHVNLFVDAPKCVKLAPKWRGVAPNPIKLAPNLFISAPAQIANSNAIAFINDYIRH